MIYQRIFTITSVASTHVLFQQLILEERRAADLQRARGIRTGARVLALEKAYADWQIELQNLATITAARATEHIQKRLQDTQKRPGTGLTPHLGDLIVSRPITTLGFITGQVGVADEAELDKAINPFGAQWGPYWRTQEFGSPKMAGRSVFGGFYEAGGSGAGYAPSQQYSGAHPVFISGARGTGKQLGLLRIQHPPQARHFIRDGADLALAEWRYGVKRIEEATTAAVRAALAV